MCNSKNEGEKNPFSLFTLLEMDVNETGIERHAVSVNTPESLISGCMLIDHAVKELTKTPYSTWCLSFFKSDTKLKLMTRESNMLYWNNTPEEASLPNRFYFYSMFLMLMKKNNKA